MLENQGCRSGHWCGVSSHRLFNDNKELQVWANRLISLIVGTASGFIFGNSASGVRR